MTATRPAVRLAAAFALLIFVQGCSYLGLGAKGPAPEARPGDLFKQGEDLLKRAKYEKARLAYNAIKEHDPDRTYEPLVQIRLGDSYYEEERYQEAEVEYKRFLDLHPHNKAAPYVKYQLGMCSFKQIGGPDRDPQYAVTAAARFGELLKDYPGNTYVEEATEKLRISRGKVAEHEFVVGKYYFDRGSYKAAIGRFKGITAEYKGSSLEPEVLYYLADSYERTGDFEAAKSTLSVLYQEYPNHRMAEKAKKTLSREIPQGK